VDGYLVLPGDPDALARRILDVLRAGDRRREMGRRGRDRIRAEFTFDAQARRFQEVCEGLARRRPRGAGGDDLVPGAGTTP